MTTIPIQGKNPIDEDIRKQSLMKINSLETDLLVKLSKLAINNKAKEQLKNNFSMIESFIM